MLSAEEANEVDRGTSLRLRNLSALDRPSFAMLVSNPLRPIEFPASGLAHEQRAERFAQAVTYFRPQQRLQHIFDPLLLQLLLPFRRFRYLAIRRAVRPAHRPVILDQIPVSLGRGFCSRK